MIPYRQGYILRTDGSTYNAQVPDNVAEEITEDYVPLSFAKEELQAVVNGEIDLTYMHLHTYAPTHTFLFLSPSSSFCLFVTHGRVLIPSYSFLFVNVMPSNRDDLHQLDQILRHPMLTTKST